MSSWIVCAALCFSLVVDASSSRLAEPGWHDDAFYHEGSFRQYRYYVPKLMGKEHAMVILFHDGGKDMIHCFGKNESGNNRWVDLAESDGFILLVPNGINLRTGQGRGTSLHWNDCRPESGRMNRRSSSDDVLFVRKVLNEVMPQVEVDPFRIYATGSGEGGLMALRMAFEAPDLVAAVASVNCVLPLNTECERTREPIPLWLMNGTKDEKFYWMGGNIGRRHGMAMSVPKMRKYLVSYNRVDRNKAAKISLGDEDTDDGCRVSRFFYPARDERGADLCFYTIEGGGHTIPSLRYPQTKKMTRKLGSQCRDIEMAVEAWHFMRAYWLGSRVREEKL